MSEKKDDLDKKKQDLRNGILSTVGGGVAGAGTTFAVGALTGTAATVATTTTVGVATTSAVTALSFGSAGAAAAGGASAAGAAAAGALAGSAFPIVGTVIGAAVGAGLFFLFKKK